jgi:alpha-N-arabinofuranosidase
MRDWVEYCNFAGDSTLAQERAANESAEPFRVKYWGVGNENWGCGGHFCPEDYAAEYKRYATYLHEFPGAPLFLIACGPSGNDPDWTRRFFAKLQRFSGIHGCAAHYYCGTAGTATDYTADQWYELLLKSTAMEALILQQRQILDDFYPKRRIELIVDEWGTWHPPTPGRNPKHLWQQNTLRDALVAAITLDLFNKHADKVFMANLAQTVNVLQALILTHEDKLLLTPTHHVFQMYQLHQGAQSVRTQVEAEQIGFSCGGEKRKLAGLLGSASVSANVLTLSVVNTSADAPVETTIRLRGGSAHHASGVELSHADLRAHNTFEAPETVKPRALPAIALAGECRYVFPPASVTVLRMPLG